MTDLQTGVPVILQPDRQTGRQTDRRTDLQTDKQERAGRQADGHNCKPIGGTH